MADESPSRALPCLVVEHVGQVLQRLLQPFFGAFGKRKEGSLPASRGLSCHSQKPVKITDPGKTKQDRSQTNKRHTERQNTNEQNFLNDGEITLLVACVGTCKTQLSQSESFQFILFAVCMCVCVCKFEVSSFSVW